MRKRRSRQPDVVDNGSEDSSESGDKANSGGSCPHVAKGSQPGKVMAILKKTGIATECAACKKLGCHEPPADEEGFSTMMPPLWICLRCGHQACGRTQKAHAQAHFKTPHSDCHCIAVDTHLWSVWCYQCETEIRSDCRKGLLKIIEFSKKLASSSTSVVKQAIPLPSVQMHSAIDNIEDKKVPLNGLTKVVGLANLGNTCFLNAVLQCIAQTPFLVKVLEDLEAAGEKFILPGGKFKVTEDSEEIELPPIEGTLDGWGSFTAILCKTLKTMQSMKTNQTYVPQELLTTFRKKSVQCMDGGQHDSHELLRHLLELVRTEDLRRYHTIILKEAGISRSKKSVDDTIKANLKFYGRQASARLLGPEFVFRGVLVSTLECIECHHSSQRTEPFLDLSLPVMADKPQPPVFKRKNSGLDDTFDLMGNNMSSTPSSKHQSKKEDKNSERHRRQLRRRSRESNYVSPANKGLVLFGNTNSISEENQTGPVESESDADVEDNISAPDIVESGYSSEKVSAVASPVSPTNPDLSNSSINQSDLNGTTVNGNLPLSPVEASDSMRLANDENSTNTEFSQRSLMNVTTNLNQVAMQRSDTSSVESPTTGADNEIGELAGLSPSTSLIVNSELSPEVATISPLSSPITSKDSPLSLPSSATDDENTQAEMNALRLLIENPWSTKLTLADMVNPEYQTPKIQEDKSSQNFTDPPEVKLDNGVADITVGLSKVAVTENTQPTRYHTKEGDCSIQSCLNQFTALELMSGSNKVGCEACTARENKGKEGSTKMVCTPSTKQYLISRVPAVLILHLKRFQSQRMAGFRKVAKHVTFPILLDLAPVCKGGGKTKLYSLYGVVEHSGTLHGGHYVAYVKTRPPLTPEDPRWAFLPSKDSKESAENSSASSSDSEGAEKKASLSTESPPGRWYYVSDSRVSEVDEASVLQSQAYILFYERIL